MAFILNQTGSHLEGSEQRSDDLFKRIALAAVQRTEYRGERRSRETTLEAILAVQAGNDAGLHHGVVVVVRISQTLYIF